MIKKKAKLLWEDVLIHGTNSKIHERLGISKQKAKIFMSYTAPEMFVDKEINRINLLKIKELKQESKKIMSLINKKQSSNLILTIGMSFYFTIVMPILALIVYIKYF